MTFKNNPFNLRYNPYNTWRGQSTPKRGFCQFTDEEYGIRAAVTLIRNYIRRGLNTPEKIITRFAPPSENDTENYISYVCQYTLSPDTIIRSIFSSEFCVLLCRMAYYETNTLYSILDIDNVIDKFNISDVK